MHYFNYKFVRLRRLQKEERRRERERERHDLRQRLRFEQTANATGN